MPGTPLSALETVLADTHLAGDLAQSGLGKHCKILASRYSGGENAVKQKRITALFHKAREQAYIFLVLLDIYKSL
jgi:hypothetical protein